MNSAKRLSRTICDETSIFFYLTKRHFMVFFKNWVTLIFTMLVPIIILLIYILFLRNLETDQILSYIRDSGAVLDEDSSEFKAFLHQVYAIADSWMISGVLAVSCITVSLNSCYILVRDKESGIDRDFLSSPIKKSVIMASYFSFDTLVTFLINLVVYFICLIYLACYGAYMISLLDFFSIIGVLLLSTICASLITFFICSFISKESVLSSLVAIFSAAIGFMIGAYLPPDMLPTAVNRATTFFPGTYSAGLLRNYFMTTPISKLQNSTYVIENGLSDVIDSIQENFSLNIDFFGWNVTPGVMALVLLAFSGIFLVLNIIFANRNLLKLPKPKKRAQKDR